MMRVVAVLWGVFGTRVIKDRRHAMRKNAGQVMSATRR